MGCDFDEETVKVSSVKIGVRFKNLNYNIEKKKKTMPKVICYSSTPSFFFEDASCLSVNKL